MKRELYRNIGKFEKSEKNYIVGLMIGYDFSAFGFNRDCSKKNAASRISVFHCTMEAGSAREMRVLLALFLEIKYEKILKTDMG